MARPLWNDDWGGAAYTGNRVESWNDMVAARNERRGAVRTDGAYALGSDRFQVDAASFRSAAAALLIAGDSRPHWLAAAGAVEGAAGIGGAAVTAMLEAQCYDYGRVTAEILGGVGFTQCYPLEFLTMASAAYNDPAVTAFADGDVARCLATGKVYTRTAGAWVYAPSTLPHRRVFWDNDGDATYRADGGVFGGDLFGDYVTTEMFTEARDVLNAMTDYVHTDTESAIWTSLSTNQAKLASDEPGANAAAAKAAAAAVFAGDARDHDTYGPAAEAWVTDGGMGAGATLYRNRAKLLVYTLLAESKKDLDFYACATQFAGHAFDANGDAVANGTYHKYETVAAVAAADTDATSGYLGTLGQPAFGAATDGTRYGYYVPPASFPPLVEADLVGGAAAVARYAVAGGFQFTAAT